MTIIKCFLGLCGLVFVGVAGWQLGGRLSSDAIGMALGVLFGIMAGIPATLMVLLVRRDDGEPGSRYGDEEGYWRERYWQLRLEQSASQGRELPVILVGEMAELGDGG